MRFLPADEYSSKQKELCKMIHHGLDTTLPVSFAGACCTIRRQFDFDPREN